VAKVIDFGIAKTDVARERTGAGIVKGKYAYMAPEQIRGHRLDRRTDVYALGLVLYEMLTNAPAISGADPPSLMSAAAMPHFRAIEELREDVPAQLTRICARALAPNPEARYASALALSQDLEAYVREAAPTLSDIDLIKLLPLEESGVMVGAPPPAPGSGSLAPLPDTFVRGTTSARSKQRLGAWVGGGAVLALTLGAALFLWRQPNKPPPPFVLATLPPPSRAAEPSVVVPPRPEPSPVSQTSPVEESRSPPVSPPPNRRPPADHHRGAGPGPPAATTRPPSPAATQHGLVEFRAAPYAEVFLGDRSLGVTPFKPVELAAGHYRFKLVNPLSGKSEVREIEVNPGSRQTVAVDLNGP
jgi:serine/threonine protein kinase